jgi:hypothetical protein
MPDWTVSVTVADTAAAATRLDAINGLAGRLTKAGYAVLPGGTAEAHVATDVWEQDPDKPKGCRRRARVKAIGEVFAELVAVTGELGPGHDEYFIVTTDHHGELWPDGRIACYAVTGGSEGHYVHVDVISSDTATGDASQPGTVLLAKTFDGFDAAHAFAGQLARILGA